MEDPWALAVVGSEKWYSSAKGYEGEGQGARVRDTAPFWFGQLAADPSR